MEERILGTGTPLGFSSDLELPVMDPNSRIPDSDDEGVGTGGGPGVKDISWELTENLDDIEMPDLDLDIDDVANDNGDNNTQNDTDKLQTDTGNAQNDTDTNRILTEVDLQYKSVNLDDFFDSKTPELPKRSGIGVQGDSLRSTISDVQTPKFPQLEDESPLITFTP